MPRSSVRRKKWSRRLPYDAQALESKALRDATVAIARRNVISSVGPNVAQRGLQLSEGEFKYLDATGTLDVDTTTEVALLNGCNRGDDVGQRNGREIVMRSIEFRYACYPQPATGSDQRHRVMLVYDRQCNATATYASNVLAMSSTISPRNMENRRRFKILYDRVHNINSSPESGSYVTRKFYRHLRHPVTFNSGDAGTVADISTGSLYLIVIGSNAAGNTAGLCNYYCRIRFQDK